MEVPQGHGVKVESNAEGIKTNETQSAALQSLRLQISVICDRCSQSEISLKVAMREIQRENYIQRTV